MDGGGRGAGADQLPARLIAAIDFTDGCWLWRQSTNNKGYGQVHWEGRNRLAHQLVYRLLRGWTPEALHHTCGVRRCVRPDHLVPTTRAAHNRLHLTEACSRGHAWTPENTYYRADTGRRQCRACRAAAARRRYLTDPARFIRERQERRDRGRR
jgi:hypothetical protein